MTKKAYCVCGAAVEVSALPHIERRVLEIFWQNHQGEGHGICDARTALRARRKAEIVDSEKGDHKGTKKEEE